MVENGKSLKGRFPMDQSALKSFTDLGFMVTRNFLQGETASAIRKIAAKDEAIAKNVHERQDSAGRKSKVTLWYEPGDDVFGRLSCSDKMINHMTACLGGPVEFFHAKLMQKEAHIGGAWEWHQDYGYWYDDGFLTDNMASCYVALDPATLDNGCLRVIPGSHKYGRIRHGSVGGQTGADMARVETLKSRHEPVYVTLDPGDAVFFHSNLLHASNPNLSDQSRWGLISCFFREDNQSILDDPRFRAKVIASVPHERILEGSAVSD